MKFLPFDLLLPSILIVELNLLLGLLVPRWLKVVKPESKQNSKSLDCHVREVSSSNNLVVEVLYGKVSKHATISELMSCDFDVHSFFVEVNAVLPPFLPPF